MHVDLDITEASIDASLKVEGDSNITIAIYAPNGCNITSATTPLFPDLSYSIPVFNTGLSVKLTATASRRTNLGLKPRGSVAKFGWRSVLASRAGVLDNHLYRDFQLVNTANRTLKSAALHIRCEYTSISTIGAALAVGPIANVGINLGWETYARLTANVSFPDPIPGLQSAAYNPKSLLKYGDCR